MAQVPHTSRHLPTWPCCTFFLWFAGGQSNQRCVHCQIPFRHHVICCVITLWSSCQDDVDTMWVVMTVFLPSWHHVVVTMSTPCHDHLITMSLFFCCHITPCQYHAATMLVRCQVHVVTLEQVIDISLFHVITTLLSFISTISSPPTCHVIAIWPLRPYHVITISLPYHSDLVTMSSPCHYQATTMSLPRRSHVMTMYPEHRILIHINKLPSFQIYFEKFDHSWFLFEKIRFEFFGSKKCFFDFQIDFFDFPKALFSCFCSRSFDQELAKEQQHFNCKELPWKRTSLK